MDCSKGDRINNSIIRRIIIIFILLLLSILFTNCSKDPFSSYQLTPTNTDTISPTMTNTCTSTLTRINTSTPTMTYTITRTWTPESNKVNEYCYDNSKEWTFDILKHPATDSDIKTINNYGFFLNIIDENRIGMNIEKQSKYEITKGIYYYFPVNYSEISIDLEYKIYNFDSNSDCGDNYEEGNCVIDLFFGIGDPSNIPMTKNTGKFVMYRVLNKGFALLLCTVGGLFGNQNDCINNESLHNYIEYKDYSRAYSIGRFHELEFIITGNLLTVSIDDYPIPIILNEAIDNYPKIFWIGYHMRQSGTIKAFISCPIISIT